MRATTVASVALAVDLERREPLITAEDAPCAFFADGLWDGEAHAVHAVDAIGHAPAMSRTLPAGDWGHDVIEHPLLVESSLDLGGRVRHTGSDFVFHQAGSCMAGLVIGDE